MWIRTGPEGQGDASLVAFPGLAAEGDVQLLLDLRILDPMAFCESEERAVARAVTEDRAHLMMLGQVVARGPEALVELGVVRVQQRIGVDSFQISTVLDPSEVDAADVGGSLLCCRHRPVALLSRRCGVAVVVDHR